MRCPSPKGSRLFFSSRFPSLITARAKALPRAHGRMLAQQLFSSHLAVMRRSRGALRSRAVAEARPLPPAHAVRAAALEPVPGLARELGVPLRCDLLQQQRWAAEVDPADEALLAASQQVLPARARAGGAGAQSGFRRRRGPARRAAAGAAAPPIPPHDDDDDGFDGGAGGGARAPRPHDERLRAAFASSEASRPRRVAAALLAARACAATITGEISLQEVVEARLFAAVRNHACLRVRGCAPRAILGFRCVTLVDLGARYVVELPTLRCAGTPAPLAPGSAPNLPCCEGDCWEPQLAALGFVSAADTAPTLGFSTRLLDQVRREACVSTRLTPLPVLVQRAEGVVQAGRHRLRRLAARRHRAGQQRPGAVRRINGVVAHAC